MNHLRNKEIVSDHIKKLNKELEKELGMKISKKVWDLFNTLVIKVGQKQEIDMSMLNDVMDDVITKQEKQ